MNEKLLTLLIGPARYPEDDERMVKMFLAEPGRKIICGSSTASMVSRFLDHPQQLNEVSIPGLALVTDGTLVLGQVLEVLLNTGGLEALSEQKDAQIIASYLYEAEKVSFFIGMAINKSQRSLSLPAKPIIKSRLARELVNLLQEKGKKVLVEYF